MPRTVVLRHDLPDGTSHFDWMLEVPRGAGGEGGQGPEGNAADERRLMTFRTAARPDGGTGFEAERIGDHRNVYLTYQGEVSGGRGTVTRVAEGSYELVAGGGGTLELVVRFEAEGPALRLAGQRIKGEIWRFSLR